MKTAFTDGHHVFEGIVTHERFKPKSHRLSYKLFYLLIDLDQTEELNNLSPFWSTKRFNLVQFRPKDYMNLGKQSSTNLSLKSSATDVIFKQTKEKFNGKIFLLSNLRYWGYCFNPVSYYFCFDENGSLQYIIDEVTNTPWKERHHYVHKISETSSQNNTKQSRKLIFNFEKSFHVSPFMPMNMSYKTDYSLSNEKILIHMDLFEKTEKETSNNTANNLTRVFFATLNLRSKPLTKTTASLLPFKFPFQCSKIIISIYWQALKLWIKRVPFFSHPSR